MIVVLWLTLVMTSLALSFSNSVRLSIQSTSHYVEKTESRLAMDGALNYYKLILEQAYENSEVPDEALYESEGLKVGESTLWLVGRNHNEDDDHTIHFGLVDECGKLDLNTASREMLLNLPGMDEALVDALMDWRDSDEETRDQGAESDYYLSLDKAYECKNAPFESIEELRLVKGFDLEVIYGEDFNRNGVLESNEDDADEQEPADNKNGQLNRGLIEYLTVYSTQPNVSRDGEDRIELSESQELRSFFRTNFGEERGNQLFAKSSSIGEVKSLLEFAIKIQVEPEEYSVILDGLTLEETSVLRGQVNLFSASKDVLKCLPNINAPLADELIQFRTSNTDRQNDLLWLGDILSEEKLIELGPYVTHRSVVYSADIVSLGRHGKNFSRSFNVLRLQDGEAKLIWREDIEHLGHPLSEEVIESVL